MIWLNHPWYFLRGNVFSQWHFFGTLDLFSKIHWQIWAKNWPWQSIILCLILKYALVIFQRKLSPLDISLLVQWLFALGNHIYLEAWQSMTERHILITWLRVFVCKFVYLSISHLYLYEIREIPKPGSLLVMVPQINYRGYS